MGRTVLLDEIHLALRVPSNLQPRAVRAISRVLTSRDLLGQIRAAVRTVLTGHPALTSVIVRVSR